MNPRLLGKPGVGKTTLAYAAAKRLGREVYIMQATVDTRPEDLLVTPVIEGEARLRYVASPLVTAMLRGGIVILDEGNRMSEKSWASLAPLLDNRRYVESIVAGIKIKAHPLFRAGGDHERRRQHLRSARIHPLPPAAANPDRFSGAPRGIRDPARESALRRRSDPELRHRFPAAGARRRRTLHGARRHQHRALRHEAGAARRIGRRPAQPAETLRSRSCRLSAKRPCAMSLETDIKPGGLRARAASATFRWCPGAWSSRVALRRLLLADKPADRRGGTARISGDRLPARAGAAAGNVGDPLSPIEANGEDDRRDLRSRGAGRSVHRSAAHGRRDRRGGDLPGARFARSARICPTRIPTLTRSGASASITTSKPIASGRRRAPKK